VLAHTLIAYLPHVGALPESETPRPTGPALVVADPTGDLPQAHRQGRRLAATLQAGTALFGLQATPAALQAGLRAGPRVFHFAGHGVVDPAAPWNAHLRLADGQRLTLADLVMGGPAGAAPGLVVLDGCDTGLSLRLGRYDAVGLPEAFLLAGARTVLATLRPIADGASMTFLERFYALGGAERPGEAFRQAALASAAAGDDVWRDFYLVGRPR
jgi:CHAT domain-containing protein